MELELDPLHLLPKRLWQADPGIGLGCRCHLTAFHQLAV